MVEDVRADDGMEEVGVDKAEVAVDGCGCTEDKRKGVRRVVREGGVRVLEVGDCYFGGISTNLTGDHMNKKLEAL